MGLFERYLSLWVAIAIVTGAALGSVFPAFFFIGRWASVCPRQYCYRIAYCGARNHRA